MSDQLTSIAAYIRLLDELANHPRELVPVPVTLDDPFLAIAEWRKLRGDFDVAVVQQVI